MRTAGRSSHADGKALLRSCCLVVELDVEAAPEHLLFRGVRKRIRSAQPPFAQQNLKWGCAVTVSEGNCDLLALV